MYLKSNIMFMTKILPLKDIDSSDTSSVIYIYNTRTEI